MNAEQPSDVIAEALEEWDEHEFGFVTEKLLAALSEAGFVVVRKEDWPLCAYIKCALPGGHKGRHRGLVASQEGTPDG